MRCLRTRQWVFEVYEAARFRNFQNCPELHIVRLVWFPSGISTDTRKCRKAKGLTYSEVLGF